MNKTPTHGFVNQLLVYTLVMICFSGTIGLGTVWLRQQIAQTANNVKQLQSRADTIERHIEEMTLSIEQERALDNLARRNQEWKLGLVPPTERQVVRLGGQPEYRLAQKLNNDRFKPAPEVAPVRFVMGDSAH